MCETCTKLASAVEDMGNQIIGLRSRNKILSTVNRALFDRLNKLQTEFDEFVSQLNEADEELVNRILSNRVVSEATVGLPTPV